MDNTVIQSFDTVVNFDEDFPSGCDSLIFAEPSVGTMKQLSKSKPASNILSKPNVISTSINSSSEQHSRLYNQSYQPIPQQCSSSNGGLKMEMKSSQIDDNLHAACSNDNIIHIAEAKDHQRQTDKLLSDSLAKNYTLLNRTTTSPSSTIHSGNEFRVPTEHTDDINSVFHHTRAIRRISSLDWSRRPQSMFNAGLETEVQFLREQLSGRTIEAETMSRRLISMVDEERIIKSRLNAIARNGSLKADTVISLKSTVACLYADVESLRSAHTQSLDHQTDLEEDIQSLKRSRDWYNEQLRLARETRDQLQSESEQLHILLRQGEDLNHRLVHENACLQAQLACSQAALVEAKRSLSHQLEGIRVDMIEREAVFENLSAEQLSLKCANTQRESELYQLRVEVSGVKANLRVAEEQAELEHSKFIELESEFTETQVRCQDLQNNLFTSENQRKCTETRFKEQMEEHQMLMKKLEALQNSFLRSDAAYEQLFEEKNSLLSALKNAQYEKSTLDAHLIRLKDDLSRVEVSFDKLRSELENKSNVINQLLDERYNLMSKLESLQEHLYKSQHAIKTLNMESSDFQKALNIQLTNELCCVGSAENINPRFIDCMVQTVKLQSSDHSQQTEIQLSSSTKLDSVRHCLIPLVDLENTYASVALSPIASSTDYHDTICSNTEVAHFPICDTTPVYQQCDSSYSGIQALYGAGYLMADKSIADFTVVKCPPHGSPYCPLEVSAINDTQLQHHMTAKSKTVAADPDNTYKMEYMQTEEARSADGSTISEHQQPRLCSTRIDVFSLQNEVEALRHAEPVPIRDASNYFVDVRAKSPFLDSGYFSPERKINVISEDVNQHEVQRLTNGDHVKCSQTQSEPVTGDVRPIYEIQGKQTEMTYPELSLDQIKESSLLESEEPIRDDLASAKTDDNEMIIIELTRKNAELQVALEASDHHRSMAARCQTDEELEQTRKDLREAQREIQDLCEKYHRLSDETAASREMGLSSHIDEMDALKMIIKTTTEHLRAISDEMKQAHKDKTVYQTELARVRGGMRAHLERFRLFTGIGASSSGGSMTGIDLSVIEKLLGDSANLPITCSKPLDGLNKCFENLQSEIHQLENEVIHHAMAVHDMTPQNWAC